MVRKRLHISGLTPVITVNDINTRLHCFGTVLALDGFGALDALGERDSRDLFIHTLSFAVGQPKKFAYVTLEATESNLARCTVMFFLTLITHTEDVCQA